MSKTIIIHGGGLVDPSKDVILRIASNLWNDNVYDEIYIGQYSFMSLYDRSLWIKYDCDLAEMLENARGTYFGTCRGIDMSNPQLLKKAIETLIQHEVDTVIVCGGDGSARNCAEISDAFENSGINIIFAVPLTVDGINGGWSIGIEQATREAVRQIENVVATSLSTRDNGRFRVLAVELQGRNRDDILANVIQYFHRKQQIADWEIKDINLYVVAANYIADYDELIEKIDVTEKPTLVLVSEGARISIDDIKTHSKRKVRLLNVGHAVQSNGMTTKEDMERYSDWLTDVTMLIKEEPYCSYCIVNDGISRWREPIDYYAKLNPREGQKPEISIGLTRLLETYMI